MVVLMEATVLGFLPGSGVIEVSCADGFYYLHVPEGVEVHVGIRVTIVAEGDVVSSITYEEDRDV